MAKWITCMFDIGLLKVFAGFSSINKLHAKCLDALDDFVFVNTVMIIYPRTRLFPVDISGFTSFPDYWIAH